MIKEIWQYHKELFKAELCCTDQEPFKEVVDRYDSFGLETVLKGREKLLRVNNRVHTLAGILTTAGLLAAKTEDSSALMVASFGLLFGTILMHGRPGIVLAKQIDLVKSVLESRRNSIATEFMPGPI